jgi:hypothetical protein
VTAGKPVADTAGAPRDSVTAGKPVADTAGAPRDNVTAGKPVADTAGAPRDSTISSLTTGAASAKIDLPLLLGGRDASAGISVTSERRIQELQTQINRIQSRFESRGESAQDPSADSRAREIALEGMMEDMRELTKLQEEMSKVLDEESRKAIEGIKRASE